MELKIEYLPIDALQPYENNAKEHPQAQIEQIKESIKKFGMDDPIGIWGGYNTIVEGHGRLLACAELGIEKVPVVRLDHLTDEERRAYTLAHNQTTMNSGFDDDILTMELDDIQSIDMSLFGFDVDQVPEGEAIEDDYKEEIPAEPKTKPGQIYMLGNHRLMCGDSTNIDDVKKLCGGHEIDMLLTDPPYNVNYEGTAGKIENDNMNDAKFRQFLIDAFANANEVLKPGGAFYIWHADSEGFNFRNACRSIGWEIKQCLIWVKSSLVLGRQDYQWRHEPCLYGWKEGAAHYFTDSRKETTVIEDAKPDIQHMKKSELQELLEKIYDDNIATSIINMEKPSSSDLHPTMKPVKLFDYLIRNSSKPGEVVLDLFSGSGTAAIACEQNDRRAFMMEYDPKYADVIIDRWEKFTGQEAELL